MRKIILGLLPGIGVLLGYLIGERVCQTSNQWKARAGLSLYGIVGGMMTSMVSFLLIPGLMERVQWLWVFLGTLIGIIGSAGLEKRAIEGKFFSRYSILVISAFLFGSCLSMFPRGIERQIFFILIFIWCITEAMKQLQWSKIHGPLFFLQALGISMVYILAFWSGTWIQLVLFLAPCGAGVLLYTSCGNMLPQKEGIWDNFFAAVGGIFGFFLMNMLIYMVK